MLTTRQRASLGPRDLKAPGSVDWCWQVLGDLKAKWKYHNVTKEWFDSVMAEVLEHNVWERVPPEQPYGSLDAMLYAELGETFDTATAKLNCGERMQGAADTTTGKTLPKGKVNQHTLGDEVNKFSQPRKQRAMQNGISHYTQQKLDRLAREFPALHASVCAGELSTHAAAKAAGIVKDPSPLTVLRRTWKKATPAERAAFLLEIQGVQA